MSTLPRDRALDSTLALLREGYLFIGNRCRRLDTDVFEARLLGRRTICMAGAGAAAIFYDGSRMTRHGAMPAPIRHALLGSGGVQGLDGERHRRRKAMFMDLMTRERLDRLAALTVEDLRRAARDWERRSRVVLFDEMQLVLCSAVCEWAGVPLAPGEVATRTRELSDMVAFSATVSGHWRAQRARRQADAWAAGIIEGARHMDAAVPRDSPLLHIAHQVEEPGGHLLDVRTAAVELLNLLRPTVAVAYYVVFSALALHRRPDLRPALAAGEEADVEAFVQEVRRFFPFFPFAAARVREDFHWQGGHFRAGRRVLLDLYGSNHDPKTWTEASTFDPGRFRDRAPGTFELVPQGGGYHEVDHRCAGEWITIDLMKAALRFLVQGLHYRVPEQNLDVPMHAFPTRPASGFVLEDVRTVD